jgi:hypothetical protein
MVQFGDSLRQRSEVPGINSMIHVDIFDEHCTPFTHLTPNELRLGKSIFKIIGDKIK